MTAPVLEIRNLVKTFAVKGAFGRAARVVRAVDDVSFSIVAGEVFGLAGESGSGKSTIARMIMGLAQPDSGDILIDGQSILGARHDAGAPAKGADGVPEPRGFAKPAADRGAVGPRAT